MSDNILKIKNVTKKYQRAKALTITACNDISLEIKKGEFISVVGESGCGKSTLLKIISNMEVKTTGEVIFEGKDITQLKPKQLRENRKSIQYLFQDTTSSLNPKMCVMDIICEPMLNFGLIKKCEVKNIARDFLAKVELDETFLYKKPNEMSGGQRQRVSLARALALTPKILLLDEPTSALDVITQTKIINLIKKLQVENKLTVIFVCHDLAVVANVSDRIAVMQKGEIIEVTTSANLVNGNVQAYTNKLLHSIFDMKKCGCRFDQHCVHDHCCVKSVVVS